MCQEWKDKCDTALATPFPGDPLCFEKVCTYYAPSADVISCTQESV